MNSLEVAVVRESIPPRMDEWMPWTRYRQQLASDGITIRSFTADEEAVFKRPWDAMMVFAWQDWRNRQRFDPYRIMPLMERHACYRSAFPDTVQICLNHTDMSRRPYVTSWWRQGDPVLYRTPAYDRSELAPLPAEHIWAFEKIWGSPAFSHPAKPRYAAGFIGRPSGPKGYREQVARFTDQVGVGNCSAEHQLTREEHDRLMSQCQIIVCPRGWGEQSQRHWDAWFSGKPVLTDRDCDAVEMIPGRRLEAGEHYLVYEEPAQIPELVREWTDPSRRARLKDIAMNGKQAAESYDGYANIRDFFLDAIAPLTINADREH